MANTLNIDLTDEVVILKETFFRKDLTATDHPFLCQAGFGLLPYTIGTAISGTFLSDGERAVVSGHDVARLATTTERKTADDIFTK